MKHKRWICPVCGSSRGLIPGMSNRHPEGWTSSVCDYHTGFDYCRTCHACFTYNERGKHVLHIEER